MWAECGIKEKIHNKLLMITKILFSLCYSETTYGGCMDIDKKYFCVRRSRKLSIHNIVFLIQCQVYFYLILFAQFAMQQLETSFTI